MCGKDGLGSKEKMKTITLAKKTKQPSQIDFKDRLFKLNYLLEGLSKGKNYDKKDRKI